MNNVNTSITSLLQKQRKLNERKTTSNNTPQQFLAQPVQLKIKHIGWLSDLSTKPSLNPDMKMKETLGCTREHASALGLHNDNNKQLSYCRQTALQGGSVLAKSRRRYSADIIMWRNQPPKLSSSVNKITQNKCYYAVQDHSMSPM